MADRSYRGRWTAVACCLVASLAGCTATPAPGATADPVQVRVLQLNLCGSGIAGCYTGRSTAEAAAAVRAEAPDLVTLNEICADDLLPLERALAEAVPGGGVASAFQAARDAPTGQPYRCRDGAEYGIGIVSRWPAVPAGGGIYPAQDRADPEERAWLCLDVTGAVPVTVCTTHLAHTRRDVAVAQCRYLFGTVIAGLRARDGAAPVVLAGDLNLGSGDGADLSSCLPAGSARVDDGGPQLVVATPELVVDDVSTIDLRGSTDHPGVLVTFGRR